MIEESIVERLETGTAIQALCGDRIYDSPAPQNALRPHITYDLGAEDRDRALAGPTGLVRGTFQIDSWAATKDAARTVAEAVRVRFDNFSGNLAGHQIQRTKLTNRVTSWQFRAEGTEDVWPHVSLTFDVWYAESLPEA